MVSITAIKPRFVLLYGTEWNKSNRGFSMNLNQSISNANVEWIVMQERLRQAHLSFNLALIATGICFFITLIGGGLLLLDKVSSGTITSAVGLVSSVGCLKLAKDTNDRLDKILAEPDKED